MLKSRLRSDSKSPWRIESKQIACKYQNLSKKLKSDNISDMNVDDQKPPYDSLIHKSKIN